MVLLSGLGRILDIAVWTNIALVWVWFGLHTFVGERVGVVEALDMFAMYFFLPLAIAVPRIAYRRSAALWGAWTSSLALFTWLWSGLVLPVSRTNETGHFLRVMTYNVLGLHDDYQALIENIRDARPDVVLLQEVNPDFARQVEEQLASEYPFRLLDPKPGVNGMGTLSRYPIEPTGDSIDLVWIGTPQLLWMNWSGAQVLLVNFHTLPPRLSWEKYMRENFRIRNEQARAIASFVNARLEHAPVLCAGDLNAVDISTAYRALREQMRDAWLDGAVGLGNTFPNTAVRNRGFSVPRRMFRIDYIFASRHFEARDAFLARDTGKSDHRGVVADLVIRNAD